MRCPECQAPAQMVSGASYSLSGPDEDDFYEYCFEYRCGANGAGGYSCGRVFVVLVREDLNAAEGPMKKTV